MYSLPLMRATLIAALLCTSCYRMSPKFYAPVLGPGPLTNIGTSEQANTNAAAHVGWALAIPLAGDACYGRKGMWTAGLGWIGFTLASELAFHAPDNAGPSYPSEFRTDLLTRLLPTVALLSLDLLLRKDP